MDSVISFFLVNYSVISLNVLKILHGYSGKFSLCHVF